MAEFSASREYHNLGGLCREVHYQVSAKGYTAEDAVEITNLAHFEVEKLHEACERFKRLLRKCPQHNLSEVEKAAKLYDGILYNVKSTFDAAANGDSMLFHLEKGKS